MTGSDTHREAVEAIVAAFPGSNPNEVWISIRDTLDANGYDPFFEFIVDAIPASVLARLAVERGGLELCGYMDHSLEPLVFGTPGELVTEVEHLHDGDQPVYRIVEDTDE